MKKELFSSDELTILESLSVYGGYQATPSATNVVCPEVQKDCTMNPKFVTYTECTILSPLTCGAINDTIGCGNK